MQCQSVSASADGETGLTLPHGGFTLENKAGAPIEVKLGRFASGLSVNLGPVPAGVKTALTIPVDESNRPWVSGLVGEGPARLCTTVSG